MSALTPSAAQQILDDLVRWAEDLGFWGLAVSRVNLAEDDALLDRWLAAGKHGSMDYLARNRELRRQPELLHPGTLSVICVRMPYWTDAAPTRAILKDGSKAFISRYALGRDYHKVVRSKLRQLARQLEERIGPFGFRAFADSAPILEKALARDASLGWIGKHTLLIDENRGSYFFLGELFTDLPLPANPEPPAQNRCGSCQACIRACPTGAIGPNGGIDARRCISYLTIELHESIPLELREAIGNRIFGCDDCQVFCPFNRDPAVGSTADFKVRHHLDDISLIELLSWSEAEFLQKTEGMAIRRTGYQGWLRNIAVALGNGPSTPEATQALTDAKPRAGEIALEHMEWALARLSSRRATETD